MDKDTNRKKKRKHRRREPWVSDPGMRISIDYPDQVCRVQLFDGRELCAEFGFNLGWLPWVAKGLANMQRSEDDREKFGGIIA